MPLVLTEGTGVNLTPSGGNLSVAATAAEILTLIKTVDGASSGLDADLLDGVEAAGFATAAQGTLAASALQATDIAVTTGANGTSVRFPSGVQVFFRTLGLGSREAVGGGAADNPYMTTPVNITWQQAFSAAPTVNITVAVDNTDGANKGNVPTFESVSTTGLSQLQSVALSGESLTTPDVTAHIFAVGTWS